MPKLVSAKRRWAHLTEEPRILSTSIGAGWQGFEFYEIEVPEVGAFDGSCRTFDLVWISQNLGPMKIRYGSAKMPFQDLLPYPQLSLPSDRRTGAWEGSQRGLHLFIDTRAIERFNHEPFNQDAFLGLEGPNSSVEHLLRILHIDVQHGHPTGSLLGETILALLLQLLLPGASQRNDLPERQRLARIEFERIREWIDAHIGQPFTLEDLAREVGVSVRHLHRAFAATTGLTPYRYILAQRVERAKQLIQAGRLNLSDIATIVGFYDQAHMANTFRKLLGASPSHFSNTAK